MLMLYRCPACDAPVGSCGESECAMATLENPYGSCGADVGCEFDQKSVALFPTKGFPMSTPKRIWVGSGEDSSVCC